MSQEIAVIEAEIVAPLDPLDAFEWFLQIDVANGDATRDTVAAYRREVGFYLGWCEKNGIDALFASRDDIELFRESLKNRGMATTTRQSKLSIVRRFYAAAIRHGLIEKNPADGVRAGKNLTAPEDTIKALGLGALGKLVSAIPGDTLAGARDRAVVALMALHGLRRIEVHRLNHESLQNDDESAPFLEVEGKGSKKRRVYLRADTLAVLEAYSHAKFSAKLPLEGAVFVAHGNNGRGNRLSRQALNVIIDKHLGASNLKKAGVSCHALRHTFGTLSIAGGAKIEHLRDAMGHAKIDTTSIYVRAVEKAKNNPANYIDVEI